MSQALKIVNAFLNSAEGYFHTKRIIEEQVKQPRDLYGPMSDRPERWDYTDIRDISTKNLDSILKEASKNLDKELYGISPDTALNAALGYAIHTLDFGRFQAKIDCPTYLHLYNSLKKKVSRR